MTLHDSNRVARRIFAPKEVEAFSCMDQGTRERSLGICRCQGTKRELAAKLPVCAPGRLDWAGKAVEIEPDGKDGWLEFGRLFPPDGRAGVSIANGGDEFLIRPPGREDFVGGFELLGGHWEIGPCQC